MINVNDIYLATRDDTNKEENGYLSFDMFNRDLKRAELYLLRFLTGDLIMSNDFPVPYDTQKIKDYLAPFIVSFRATGDFKLPVDYYHWQGLSKIGMKYKTCGCDDEENDCHHDYVEGCNVSIPIVGQDEFNSRCASYIKGIRPTPFNPLAKILNGGIVTVPKNIGSVELEYIRYPKFAKLVGMKDMVYNQIVYDPVNSVNSEFGEWAIEALVWFITNRFQTHTSNQSGKQMAQLDKAEKRG